MTIYRKGDAIDAGAMPSMLAIGDSWFWYLEADNLISALVGHPKLIEPLRNVYLLGENGARLAEYTQGKNAKDWLTELTEQNFHYSVVLISGAGNDAVDYHLALNTDCTGLNSAKQCISNEGMKSLIYSIVANMKILIQQVEKSAERCQKKFPIEVFFHGYDYPIPDGRPFKLARIKLKGPWLKYWMQTRLPLA